MPRDQSHLNRRVPGDGPPRNQLLEPEVSLRILERGNIESWEVMPWASNYTMCLLISSDEGSCLAVYKPRRGEAPLWDFPSGTLYRREYASYLASQSLGWSFIPPTVIREGPYGVGSVQLYIETEPRADYFKFRGEHTAELQRIALFDALANNADRKAGHCLKGLDGRIWGIDQGLTFNSVHKLRTVIWDWAGKPIPKDMLEELRAFQRQLSPKSALVNALAKLIAEEEIEAARKRLSTLLSTGIFPHPGPYRSVPWPVY